MKGGSNPHIHHFFNRMHCFKPECTAVLFCQSALRHELNNTRMSHCVKCVTISILVLFVAQCILVKVAQCTLVKCNAVKLIGILSNRISFSQQAVLTKRSLDENTLTEASMLVAFLITNVHSTITGHSVIIFVQTKCAKKPD